MRSNISIVKDLYKAFSKSDFKTAGDLMHPHIKWVQMEGFPGGRIYTGTLSVVEDLFHSFPRSWEYWKSLPEEFHESGNRVFVYGKYDAKNLTTGKVFTAPFMHEYIIENELLTYFRQFTDTHMIQSAMK